MKQRREKSLTDKIIDVYMDESIPDEYVHGLLKTNCL